MRFWVISMVVAFVTVRAQRAEACACCDAKYKRTPIGWDASGAVLIDAADTVACEPKKRLEVYSAGSEEPSGCFDMYGDPEKEIACGDITSAGSPKDKPKKASKAAKKRFAKAPTRMSGTKFRVKQAWRDPDSPSELEVVVELRTKDGWTSGWSGTITPTTDKPKVKLDVSLWPDPKGERAVVILGYVTHGTGNQQVDVRWVPIVK